MNYNFFKLLEYLADLPHQVFYLPVLISIFVTCWMPMEEFLKYLYFSRSIT